jgi:hypothetical protein
MLHAPIGIGVVRKAEELLCLLLLESTHLILEYLALQKTLAFVLETLELDTLQERNVSNNNNSTATRRAHGGHIRHITAQPRGLRQEIRFATTASTVRTER